MTILLFPADQIRPVGPARIEGFFAEVKDLSTNQLDIKGVRDDGQPFEITLDWVAAGVYRHQGKDYAVTTALNPAVGDVRP